MNIKPIRIALLCVAAAVTHVHAQTSPQYHFESNIPPGVVLRRGVSPAPAKPIAAAAETPGQAHQRICILEGALLEKVASMRDLGVPQRDAQRLIMQDATRGTSYSRPFVDDLPVRTAWVYDNGWINQNSVRMGYLKKCDPKDFNWY